MCIHVDKSTRTCSNKSQTWEVGYGTSTAGTALSISSSQKWNRNSTVTCLQGDSDVFPPVHLHHRSPASLQLPYYRTIQGLLFYSVTHILWGRTGTGSESGTLALGLVHTKLEVSHWRANCKQTGILLGSGHGILKARLQIPAAHDADPLTFPVSRYICHSLGQTCKDPPITKERWKKLRMWWLILVINLIIFRIS